MHFRKKTVIDSRLFHDLSQRIQLLQHKDIEELLLFIDFLISKHQTTIPLKKPSDRLLTDLERIPVPVNHIIIDRSNLYDDRI